MENEEIIKEDQVSGYGDSHEQSCVNAELDESTISTLKKAKIVIIVGWPLLILIVGIYLAFIGSAIVGIQFIRKQRLKKGVLIMLFGGITLGIWPFISASKEIKNAEIGVTHYDITSATFNSSLLKAFNATRILLFIAIPLVVGGYVLLLFGGLGTIMLSLFILIGGFGVAAVASAVVGIQDFRRDRLSHGACVWLFGTMTLGIWPLVYTLKQRKVISSELGQ